VPRPTAGFSDALGDRVLMFDEATSTSLELLRFKREIGESPGFESALRSRVEQLASLRHAALGTVKTIERRDQDGLMLVSKQAAGRRLSEILHAARGAAFALDFLNQIGPAVVALQKHGAGLAHGILTVDRVIVGREGRLVLVEHVLGSALASLELSPARLREFGIAVPDSQTVPFDPRLDVIQLGFVALTLLLGRRLDPADYPGKISQHLDQFTKEDAAASSRLRRWLERALQIGDAPFANAATALDAFTEIASASASATPVERTATTGAASISRSGESAQASRPGTSEQVLSPDETFPSESDVTPAPVTPRESNRRTTIVLGLVAAIEAVVIAGLVYTRPTAAAAGAVPEIATASTAVAAPPPAAPEATPAPAPSVSSSSPVAPAQPPVVAPAVPAKAEGEPPAPAGSRFGGIKVAAPIDLQVLEDGRLIGSSAGPIAISDGMHTVELVNDSLGFRFRQTVHVKPGQLTTVTISVPNGRVSINASPWADVWIDGAAAGQTPLANLTLPIGNHEIVFRHPQLGEQKQTVTVKADGLTRVSAVLQK